MKIDLQSTLNYYTPSIDPKRPVSSSATPHKAAGNFDAITIQSDARISQEDQFSKALASRISMEIRKPASTGKLEQLQQQIDQGNYQVDIPRIADRIMLY
ncbi:MAG: flagellar biosynthesis anti-sigma factor FlgM [Hungatella sp.]